MIGLLRGIILTKKPPELLIVVGGIGYEIQVSMQTFYKLPELGQEVTLFTQFIIRETTQALYGFITEYERAIFREIIKVSGVGPKSALTILSGMEIAELLRCIKQQDINCLTKMPGVGKKTAERLLVELKDKLANYMLQVDNFSTTVLSNKMQSVMTKSDARQDAVSALLSLGYKEQEAKRAISKIPEEVNESEALIKLALQAINK